MERIGDEVRQTLRRFEPARGMSDVVAVWRRVVGEEIARHAWPSRVARDGTLHVATSSSAWAFELTLLEKTVLERLTGELGPVAPGRVRFLPGTLPEPEIPEASTSSPAVAAGPREQQRAAELTATIEDENLRKLVAKAAAASLARTVSDRGV